MEADQQVQTVFGLYSHSLQLPRPVQLDLCGPVSVLIHLLVHRDRFRHLDDYTERVFVHAVRPKRDTSIASAQNQPLTRQSSPTRLQSTLKMGEKAKIKTRKLYNFSSFLFVSLSLSLFLVLFYCASKSTKKNKKKIRIKLIYLSFTNDCSNSISFAFSLEWTNCLLNDLLQ